MIFISTAAYRRRGEEVVGSQNRQHCDYDSRPSEGKVCEIDISSYNPCTTDNEYNYKKSAPCIFLKLNKIFNWKPDFYNDTNKLPKSMPEDLKTHILNEKNNHASRVKSSQSHLIIYSLK